MTGCIDTDRRQHRYQKLKFHFNARRSFRLQDSSVTLESKIVTRPNKVNSKSSIHKDK